jgi:hypothetical protein
MNADFWDYWDDAFAVNMGVIGTKLISSVTYDSGIHRNSLEGQLMRRWRSLEPFVLRNE